MGGDHKCPLCSATFTRPQHVGRHLRAHTGDRPYECKDCPLRFARSDLLARHVNKAHRPPDENAPPQDGKRGRRKSMGSHMDGSGEPKPQDRARAASFSLAGHTPQTAMPHPPPQRPIAQPIYASYPLETTSGPSGTWNQAVPSAQPPAAPQFTNPFAPTRTVMPYAGIPMRATGSEQGSSSSSRNASYGQWTGLPIGYDFGYKKRACDQCNHSKVRCDFADPCVRCINKNMPCSYNKLPKSRSSVQPIPFAAQRLSLPEYGIVTSVSPQSSFSSPYSGTSPVATTSPYAPPAPQQAAPGQDRRMSAGPSSYATQQWHPPPAPPYNMPPPQPPQVQLYSQPQQYDPRQYQPAPPFVAPISHVHSDHSVSPPIAGAATPALTSHSTSPSGPEEPPEQHRTVSGGSITASQMQLQPEPRVAGRDSVSSHGGPFAVKDYSAPLPTNWNIPPDPMYSYVTNPYIQDASSTAPDPTAYVEMDDSQQNPHRRRASTNGGVWAAAFNNMTLQDASLLYPSAGYEPPLRPSLQPVPVDDPSGRMPSMSDVKDLWKLFMTDPGATPSKEKNNCLEMAGGQVTTPRPGIGGRTLSKSNSMPDLKEATTYFEDNQWNNHRQAAAGPVQQGPQEFPFGTYSAVDYTGRPMASVLQRNLALEQTLAPERAPSFGMSSSPTTNTFSRTEPPLSQRLPATAQPHRFVPPLPPQQPRPQVAKPTSASARPGNKRLASQTLVGADGKRASLSMYEGDEFDGDEGDEAEGELVAPGWMGSAMIGGGPGAGQPVFVGGWQRMA